MSTLVKVVLMWILLVLLFAIFRCKKYETSPPPARLTTNGETEYRHKFIGKYKGTHTNWYFSQGNTTSNETPDFVDSVYMDSHQDSVIFIKNYTTYPMSFTIGAQGTGSVQLGWNVYGSVNLKNDSLYYYFNDLSAMGGSHGYYLEAKKMNP